MPTMRDQGTCIICGQPSTTVVCMRCFFNYDHRTYNSQALEKKKINKKTQTRLEDLKPDAHWDEKNQTEDLALGAMDTIDPLDAYSRGVRENIKDNLSPRNWLSRFQRFT